jgi:transcriptional regulator with XRE-family HTH domain
MPDTAIGALIKKAREAKKWTLRDLEAASGLKSGHISQIETGKIARPGPKVLWKLAGPLDLEYGHALEVADHAGPATGPRRSLAGAALSVIDDLDATEQDEIMDLMRKFLKRRGEPGS